MSITVVFVPNINVHPVLSNFISNLFGLKKKEIHDDKLKHALFAFHGPKIADKTHLINVQSSGYVNFIQVDDIMNGSISGSKFDDKGECICHHLETNFPAVGTLGTFLTNMWVLAVFCANKHTRTPITMPYFKPVKKLLAEYLLNRCPTNGFAWLNRYLEKIRSKIFSMDNLICTFFTPEGHSRYGLHIGSMLNSIFKFGGKDERYKFHHMWAKSNCFIETV